MITRYAELIFDISIISLLSRRGPNATHHEGAEMVTSAIASVKGMSS
jgi:hypothetical protein